jgi:hypothetical protein
MIGGQRDLNTTPRFFGVDDKRLPVRYKTFPVSPVCCAHSKSALRAVRRLRECVSSFVTLTAGCSWRIIEKRAFRAAVLGALQLGGDYVYLHTGSDKRFAPTVVLV